VQDDGVGIPANVLAALNTELDDDSADTNPESGYGLANVNKRIKLYYGQTIRAFAYQFAPNGNLREHHHSPHYQRTRNDKKELIYGSKEAVGSFCHCERYCHCEERFLRQSNLQLTSKSDFVIARSALRDEAISE